MSAVQPHLPLIVVAGATATGKSALGVELAHRLDGEVINADSMQLYRGMDVGTAKVSAEERRGVPHHLLDVLDVREEASVAVYQQRARQVIAEIRGRGRVPIMVGGSGLYMRAVVDVIEFPPTDPALRSRLTRQLEDEGAGPLRAELREADPRSAADIQDDRRLIRAVEVTRLTGRTFSSFMPQRLHERSVEPVRQIGLTMPRERLRERIDTRVERMAADGLLQEVRTLADRGLRDGRTASQAIGYRQFLAVLDGESTERDAIEDTATATRRFAKRQDTWFRADPRISWLEVDLDADDVVGDLADRAQALLREARSGP